MQMEWLVDPSTTVTVSQGYCYHNVAVSIWHLYATHLTPAAAMSLPIVALRTTG